MVAAEHFDRNLEMLRRNEEGETFASIARAYGLSHTRVHQIVYKTRRQLADRTFKARLRHDFRRWRDRDQPIVEMPGEVIEPEDKSRITGERLIRAFYRTLPVLYRSARDEAQRRALAERTPEAVQKEEDRRLRRKQQKREKQMAAIRERPVWRPRTQDELRAEATGRHWTEVIYWSGTDFIVRLERR